MRPLPVLVTITRSRDHQDGVGAQVAAHGFHQVDAAIFDADIHVLAVPAVVALRRVLEGEHQLLRIQHGRFGVLRSAGAGAGAGFDSLEKAFSRWALGDSVNWPRSTAPDAGAQAALPRVYAFPAGCARAAARHVPAELVGAFQLLEELHRVVDAVDAELQRVHVPGIQRDGGLAAHAEGAIRAQREIRFVFRLAQPGAPPASAAGEHAEAS